MADKGNHIPIPILNLLPVYKVCAFRQRALLLPALIPSNRSRRACHHVLQHLPPPVYAFQVIR